MTKVDITTAGHTIIVETSNADDLDQVAAKALDLYRDTQFGTGPYAASGLQVERAEPQYASGHDAEAGQRPTRYGFQNATDQHHA